MEGVCFSLETMRGHNTINTYDAPRITYLPDEPHILKDKEPKKGASPVPSRDTSRITKGRRDSEGVEVEPVPEQNVTKMTT